MQVNDVSGDVRAVPLRAERGLPDLPDGVRSGLMISIRRFHIECLKFHNHRCTLPSACPSKGWDHFFQIEPVDSWPQHSSTTQ